MQKIEEREAITLENQSEKLFAILHRPLNSSSKVPAVLICPGFAGTKSGKGRLFVRLSMELAKRGIAALRFDYRGTGDSEGDFNDITIESQVSDTLACLNFLKNDLQIDSSCLALLGRSLGGAIAILAASRYGETKSLALWSPVFTSEPWKRLWETFKSNKDSLKKQDILKMLPMGQAPNLNFITQFFGLNLESELEKLKNVPLLHIYGEQDLIVQVEHADAYKKSREKNAQTRFIALPQGDHDFSLTAEQELVIVETCEWYQKTLLI
jgi:uncharacterized protein